MGTFSQTFAPLRNRNLATYLGGQAVSLLGTAMQGTAQSWVVWELSHSAQALGLVTMLGSLPLLLFGLFGGVWADRLDRRKLLVGTQVMAMVLAFIFAILLQGHWLQLWHIYVLSFALGCVNALDMPAAGAFIRDLSGLQQVRQATVLNSMNIMASRMVGNAVAGLVVGALGVATAFWLNGASFLAVIGTLLVVQSQQVRRPAAARQRGELAEGARFIGRQPRIQDLLLFTLISTFFGMGSAQLLPAIVTDTLRQGPQVLGLISAAAGAGALISSLLLVPMAQRIARVGWAVAGGVVWSGIWLAVLAVSPWTWLSTAAMFLCALGTPVANTTANALLQVLAPENLRARLLSIWMMIIFGSQPFAALALGYLGHLLGVPRTIVLSGAGMIVVSLLILLLRPGLRAWAPDGVGRGARPAPARG